MQWQAEVWTRGYFAQVCRYRVPARSFWVAYLLARAYALWLDIRTQGEEFGIMWAVGDRWAILASGDEGWAHGACVDPHDGVEELHG